MWFEILNRDAKRNLLPNLVTIAQTVRNVKLLLSGSGSTPDAEQPICLVSSVSFSSYSLDLQGFSLRQALMSQFLMGSAPQYFKTRTVVKKKKKHVKRWSSYSTSTRFMQWLVLVLDHWPFQFLPQSERTANSIFKEHFILVSDISDPSNNGCYWENAFWSSGF